MLPDLQHALEMIQERQEKGHPMFYRPLPRKISKIVRDHYRQQLRIPEFGGADEVLIKNECETVIANGYRRVIIGDYGAFIEIQEEQVAKENIGPRFPDPQKKGVSYLWYETKDAANTKIYLQKHKVSYADYSPKMYYVSPGDVFLELTRSCSNWRKFARISHPQHTLEARRATGGEPYGNPDHKRTAKSGQWLCRNPDNEHTWVCEDQSFGLLYRPLFNDPQVRTEKTKKPREESKNRKKVAEATATPSNLDCGPLFETRED